MAQIFLITRKIHWKKLPIPGILVHRTASARQLN